MYKSMVKLKNILKYILFKDVLGRRMMSKNKTNERTIFKVVVLVFLIGVLGHSIIGFFNKAIAIYPDEWRYYQIARNIYHGNGIVIRGIPTDFQKIAYSLILMPFFSIKNATFRVMAISCINSLLMMLSIFPIWKIGEILKLDVKARFIISVGLVFIPDLLMSVTFMSEVLYWPIFFLYIYIWLINEKKKEKKYAAILGILCYVGYLTKEIFLAMFLAYIVFEILYGMIDIIVYKKMIQKEKIVNCVVYVATFLACYILFKIVAFRGMGNSYNQQSIGAILNVYNFIYMLYAFLYYIAAILVSMMIVPVAYCVAFFDKFDNIVKKMFIHIMIFLGIAIAVIAYTISVREDLGRVTPRLHFRYIAPAIVIVLIVFVYAFAKVDIDSVKRRIWKLIGISTVLILYVCAIFKGAPQSTVDEYNFKWYTELCSKIADLSIENGEIVIHTGILIINTLLIVGTAVFIFLLVKRKKLTIVFSIYIFIAISLSNNLLSYQILYKGYTVSKEAINEAERISEYFQQKDEYGTILYLTDAEVASKQARIMDTYMDTIDNLLFVNSSEVCGLDSEKEIDVKSFEFRENIWKHEYNNITTVDYIIVEVPNDNLTNVEKIDEISGDTFTVYKNIDPTKVCNRQIISWSAKDLYQNENVEIHNEYKVLKTNGMIYGPYKKLKTGDYKVTFQGENLQNCNFDIWSESSKKSFKVESVMTTPDQISCTLTLEEDISDLEMRLYNQENTEVKFIGIKIERIENTY